MVEEELEAVGGDAGEEPLVDILMATYNGARYLDEQIDSILGQSYSRWRLLVNDDGSSDETVDIVKAYVEKDDRIHLLSLENKRHDAAGNFLALLDASSASYVMFCDQDDVWLSEKVRLELQAMRELEQEYGADMPLLIFTDSAVVDENLNVLSPSFAATVPFHPSSITLSRLMVDNVAQGCVMLLNRALVQFLRQYPLRNEIGMHDYWAMIIASALGCALYLPVSTLSYRQHGNNVCGASGHPLTARRGASHIVRDPSILRGWLKRLCADEKVFQVRAAIVLEQLGSRLPPQAKDALEELSSFDGYRLSRKIHIVHTRKLLRAQRTRYVRICQFFGMIIGVSSNGRE